MDAYLREELIADTLERITEGLCALDDHWRITYLNSAAERILGRGRQELVGRNLWETFPELVGSTFDREYRRAMREQVPVAFEAFFAQSRMWVEVHAYPSARGLSVYWLDVTERRQREAECRQLLAESQQRAAQLEATIASTPGGLVVYDPDGNVVYMSPAAKDLLVYSPAECELLELEVGALVRFENPEGRPVAWEETAPQRALRGETVQGELLVTRRPPDQHPVWLSINAAPVRTPERGLLGAVATYIDVTPLRRLQEQRDEFLRALSDDLMGPLTAVQGHAQILLRGLPRQGIDGRLRKSAEAITVHARRMNASIQDLVDSARLAAGELALDLMSVDLRAFLLDLRQQQGGVVDSSRIRLEAPEGLPTCLADPNRLERVVARLLASAFRYSQPGAEVTVGVTQRERELLVRVAGPGPGVPAEVLPHLFRRDYGLPTEGPRRQALALGLYIVRELVEAHGGRIWTETRDGRAVAFSFSLPVG